MDKVLIAAQPRLRVRPPWGTSRYCPGCQHPVIEGLICRALEEMGLEDRAVIITGVGCNFMSIIHYNFDGLNAPHGRAPDIATGIKRSLGGEPFVLTVQGDGDCIAIGAEALINAAGRAERITVVMVNNTNYGTTGGQLAPTTLMGQRTGTTPGGRDVSFGYPMHTAELLTGIKGVAYSARGAVNNPANYRRTLGYLKKAFRKQMDNVGFSFVEILSACPPCWHLSPLEALERIEKEVIAEFPLGEFKDVEAVAEVRSAP